MATDRNLRYCEILHDDTYYNVWVGLDDLDELDDILQEWALTDDGPGEALTLPGDLVFCKEVSEAWSANNAGNSIYVKDAASGILEAYKTAGVSGTFPTLATVLAGGLYVMPACTAYLWSNTDFSGTFANYNIASKSFTLTANQVNYIGIKYNDGTPEYALYTDKTSFDYSSIIPVCAVFYFDSKLCVVPYGQAGYGLAEKLIEIQDKRAEFNITTDFTITGYNNSVSLSVLDVSKGANDISVLAMDTAVTGNDMWLAYKDGAGTWNYTKSATISNSQYQGTGLQTLAGGKFVINYLFRVIDSTKLIMFNVLSGSFDSLDLARNSDMITDLPDAIKEGCVLVGRFIVEQGSTSPTIQKIQRVNPFATVV